MKTRLGFDLTTVLHYIFGKQYILSFTEACKSRSGGASWYIDPTLGEQSFQYEFSTNKLFIHFVIAETVCYCNHPDGILGCECEEKEEEQFSNWPEYWDATHETIELTEAKVDNILKPNLFSSLL